MNENGRQQHSVLPRPAENGRKNTTLIWRRQSAPVGGPQNPEGDRAFIRRALIGSAVAVLVLILIGYLAYQNVSPLKQLYAGLLIERGEYRQAEKLIDGMDDEAAARNCGSGRILPAPRVMKRTAGWRTRSSCTKRRGVSRRQNRLAKSGIQTGEDV
jgi:hypothetical protein